MHMKKKEWLVKNGYLPKGSENVRGRISVENNRLLEEAVAKGVVIEGYTVSKPTSSTSKPTVERVAVSATAIVTADVEETVPEKYNVAMVGDKVIGNRTVCDVCRRSLNFHICDSPRVLYNGVSSMVVFKSRKNPETYRPNRWW